MRSDLVTRLYSALAAAGIEIPFPQHDITLRAVAPEALGLLSLRGGARPEGEAPTEAGG